MRIRWSQLVKPVFAVTIEYIHDDPNLTDNSPHSIYTSKHQLVLLLADPTWLWGRCGRHNSPPASYVMDLVFRRSDGSHVSVDTFQPSLVRSSSLSSPAWYHRQSLSSYVVLVSPLYVAKPHKSRFPAPVILSTFSLSLMFSFLTWSLSVWPHAHTYAHLH